MAAPLFDPYSRRARFFPAILTVLPLVGLVILFQESAFESITKLAFAAVAAAAIAYLLAGTARQRGKKYETDFLSRSGGWQTTVLLRHRDDTIDGLTKLRYHRALEEISNLTLPSEDDEVAAPEDADRAYRSATKALIELRRTDTFSILHAENAAYGFWRNLFALRPIALCLALLVLAIAVIELVLTSQPFASASAFTAPASSIAPCIETIAFEACYIVVFLLLVREHAVFTSARSYAEALFKTLDSPTST